MWQVAAVAGGALSERDRRIVRLKIMHISCKFKSAISREGDRKREERVGKRGSEREREGEGESRQKAKRIERTFGRHMRNICGCSLVAWLVSSCPILWLAPHEATECGWHVRVGGRLASTQAATFTAAT